MNKKGHDMNMHILIGIGVLVALWLVNQQYNWIKLPEDGAALIHLVLIGMIYSTMPDIDQPGSIINKYVTIALGGLAIWAFLNPAYQKYGIIAVAILVLLRLIEHRTLIHSVLGAAIISAPLYYINPLYALVGFIAFLSHIIADNDFSWGWEKDHKLW